MRSTFLIWDGSITTRLVKQVSRALGVTAVLATLLVASFTTAGAVDLKQNPAWCKKGAVVTTPDGKSYKIDDNYRCLTDDQYADITAQYLDVRGQLRKLRWQKDHFGNIFQPFLVVGAEKLPNVNEYHPYGLAGVNIGRVSVWGGFFADEPAYGVGWRIK